MRASAGQPDRTYLQQLCTDIGCRLEDLLGAMNDIYIYIYIYRERERERERERDEDSK